MWRAFAVSLADDFAADATSAFSAMGTPPALTHGAWTITVATSALMIPFVLNLDRLSGPKWLLAVLIVPSMLAVTALPALAMVCRDAARRPSAPRGFLIVGAAAAVIVFVAIDQGVTRANSTFRHVEGRARGIYQVKSGAREMSVTELLRLGPDGAAAAGFGHPNEFAREPHMRAAYAVSSIGYVLFGLALAKVRLRVAGALIATIFAAHLMMALWLPLVLSYTVPSLLVLGAWLPTLTLILVAVASIRCCTRAKRAA